MVKKRSFDKTFYMLRQVLGKKGVNNIRCVWHWESKLLKAVLCAGVDIANTWHMMIPLSSSSMSVGYFNSAAFQTPIL